MILQSPGHFLMQLDEQPAVNLSSDTRLDCIREILTSDDSIYNKEQSSRRHAARDLSVTQRHFFMTDPNKPSRDVTALGKPSLAYGEVFYPGVVQIMDRLVADIIQGRFKKRAVLVDAGGGNGGFLRSVSFAPIRVCSCSEQACRPFAICCNYQKKIRTFNRFSLQENFLSSTWKLLTSTEWRAMSPRNSRMIAKN